MIDRGAYKWLNDLLRQLHKKGIVQVLSFCEFVDYLWGLFTLQQLLTLSSQRSRSNVKPETGIHDLIEPKMNEGGLC